MPSDGFPNVQAAQGVSLFWGLTQIIATSISYSRSAEAEIDVTSIDSTIYVDPNNSSNKRLEKTVEYGMVDLGEVQCEFIGPSTFDETWIGAKNQLTINGLDAAPSGTQAYLKNSSIQAKAGELVTGSCTFRLTGS